MAIEINGLNNPQVTSLNAGGTAQANPQENGGGRQGETRGIGGDTVSLTQTAQKLGQLEKSLASLPVVDTEKVESIRTAIENGSYDIDPDRIANKMINLEIAMSGIR